MPGGVHFRLQLSVRPAYKMAMDLKTYLSDAGLTQAAFAARVNSTHATISRLIAGKFRPSLDLAAAIERETGGKVLAVSWAAPESRAA